ncbi:MAG: hypothetical protein HY903_01100 [Deltaproteobacteria bacterium]|nr:hypothetical protein [Deltaproteobacteria bacterium]
MSGKAERYFSGAPRDPSRPLPGEVSPGRRQLFVNLVAAVILVGVGLVIGIMLSPDSPKTLEARVRQLTAAVEARDLKINELQRAAKLQPVATPTLGGKLKPDDRKRHEAMAKKYADTLRAVKAQSAAELVEWFVGRWDELLDNPLQDDRVGRRAALLAQLVTGMSHDLHPDDFVPWQAEFLFNHKWLGELHFDQDGDGLPRKRAGMNPKDGFATTSVCQIAMAMNQATLDAEVLVTPEMECDKPENKMSVFLQGDTLDDALNEFIRACKRERFVVVEKNKQGVRLILVGKKINP